MLRFRVVAKTCDSSVSKSAGPPYNIHQTKWKRGGRHALSSDLSQLHEDSRSPGELAGKASALRKLPANLSHRSTTRIQRRRSGPKECSDDDERCGSADSARSAARGHASAVRRATAAPATPGCPKEGSGGCVDRGRLRGRGLWRGRPGCGWL